MFKIKGNYPYPILMEEKVDFKTSIIKVRYLYQCLKDGHVIKIECDVQNEEIKQLISNKKACYAVQIESPNALYRNMFEFYDEDDIKIKLGNDEVIDYIDIGIAILAKQDMPNYKNEDFVDAYEDINMKVGKNEILAVCHNVRQIIISNNETLKEVHSIFNVQKNSEIDNIKYDPNHNRILIMVPEETGNIYLKSRQSKEKIRILNSILLMPIMTNIINDMKECEEEFSNRSWFKTLIKKMDEIAKEKNTSRESLLENSFETAQILLKNITIDSIKEFKHLLESKEGDEE